MNEYREPYEQRAAAEQDAYIHGVLDQAVHDGASCVVAMLLGEPEDVVERWVDTLHDGLRDSLHDDQPAREGLCRDDRLRAIVLLLTERMQSEADEILRAVRNVR